MAETVFIFLYILLPSQGLSKPLRDLLMESCNPTFRETSHFPVSMLDCTTSPPLTVTGYHSTTPLASNSSPTASSNESMVHNKDCDNYNYLWSSGPLSTTIPYKDMMASPTSRTTISFESTVTGLNYQMINGSFPSNYLRCPVSQDDSEIIPGTEC